MLRLLERPLYIFLAYLGVITAFSIVYDCAPIATFGKDLGYLESLYLSVITITTLGYGDITPKDDLGMIATSIEAIIGILIIGLFINASWKGFSGQLDKKQSEKISQSLKTANRKNLLSYHRYLSTVLDEYLRTTIELTTPLSQRNEKRSFSEDFKFSDLQDIFEISLWAKYGYENSVIKIYYQVEEDLVREFKYVLANFGLEDFPDLRNSILEFITICHAYSVKDVLITYANRPQNDNMRSQLKEMIKQFEDIPPEEYHQSNMITPVIVLYQCINPKMNVLTRIKSNFYDISRET